MNRKVIVVGFLLILVVGLGYWWWKVNKTDDKNSINIGIVLPQVGQLSEPNQRLINGIKLGFSEIDSSKVKVNLLFEDSKGDPKIAVSAFNKLIDIDNCEVVIGEFLSSSTLAMLPIANSKQIFLISPTASNPNLSIPNDYFFRTYSSDFFDAQVAFSFMRDSLKLNNTGVLYWNNDYGKGLNDIYSDLAKRDNENNVYSFGYSDNANDFRTIVEKFKSYKTQGIYLPGSPVANATFIKQCYELNYIPFFVVNLSALEPSFLEILKSRAAGVYYSIPNSEVSKNNPIINKFKDKYKKVFGSDPDIHSLKGYEVSKIISQALENGKNRASDIKKYIEQNPRQLILGDTVLFDKNGDILNNYGLYKYDKEIKPILIKEYNFRDAQ